MIKLKTYDDGSYIPLTSPLSRRYDMGTMKNPKKAPKAVDPTKDPKSPLYKKNLVDRFVDRVFER